MTDVSPELLKRVQEFFDRECKNSTVLHYLLDKCSSESASYLDAQKVARLYGSFLARALDQITSDDLPDGKMYYNIAEKVVGSMLDQNYELISDVTTQVQKTLNRRAELGLNAIKPTQNVDRRSEILNIASNPDNYENVSTKLGVSIENYSESVVDDSVKVNFEYHSKSGLSPILIRKAESGSCKWCRNLAGRYSYDDLPDDIYRRHKNCHCIVEFFPRDGKGKKQDAWTKKWTDVTPKTQEVLEALVNDNQSVRKIKERKERDKAHERTTNVTGEYLRNSQGKTGTSRTERTRGDDTDVSDEKTADTLSRLFGWNIIVKEESPIEGVRAADYWVEEKNSFWEKKTISSKRSIDNQIHSGMGQISGNECGLVIDITGRKIPKDEAIEEIIYRTDKRSKFSNIDVIILDNEDLVAVYRNKK